MFFNYHLSDRCDLSCLGCPIHIQDTEEEFAASAVVEADLQALKKRGTRILNFTGGDPLLHPEVMDILATAKKMGFYVMVTTPGIHYTAFPGGLKGSVDLLVFIVHSAEQPVHDARTGAGSFTRMMSGIEYAKECGIPVLLAFPATRDTVQMLPEMYEFAVSKRLVLFIDPLPAADGVQGFDRETIEYLMYYGRRPHAFVNMARIWSLQRHYALEQSACLASDTMIEQALSTISVRAVLMFFSMAVLVWKLFSLRRYM